MEPPTPSTATRGIPPHGETANARWNWKVRTCSENSTTEHFAIQTQVCKGRVLKSIGLRAGETNLYCRHILSGMRGPMNFGHHAMLLFPGGPGSAALTTSPILYGQVDRVPSLLGGTSDASSYLAR